MLTMLQRSGSSALLSQHPELLAQVQLLDEFMLLTCRRKCKQFVLIADTVATITLYPDTILQHKLKAAKLHRTTKVDQQINLAKLKRNSILHTLP